MSSEMRRGRQLRHKQWLLTASCSFSRSSKVVQPLHVVLETPMTQESNYIADRSIIIGEFKVRRLQYAMVALIWKQRVGNRDDDIARSRNYTNLDFFSQRNAVSKLSGASDRSAMAGTHHAKGPNEMRVRCEPRFGGASITNRRTFA